MSMLSKQASVLISSLYKHYCDQRNNGASEYDAKFFGSSRNIHETINARLSYEEVESACNELKDAGLLECAYGGNAICDSCFTNEGIIYAKNSII